MLLLYWVTWEECKIESKEFAIIREYFEIALKSYIIYTAVFAQPNIFFC